MKNTEVWVFIFLVGLLGLTWPLLEIFRVHILVYLFAFWLVFIALVALASFKTEGGRKTG